MSGNRYPTPEEKEEFVGKLKSFLEGNFNKEKSDRYQTKDFYKGFKVFMKRKPDDIPEDELGRSLDLENIKIWLNDLNENLIPQNPSTPDPDWGRDHGKLYIKGWKSTATERGEVHHWYGPMRKSKKQRKSRKNTRKSRKNTRNNRKRRT